MNDSQKISTLSGYYFTEPTIKINGFTWKVSFHDHEDGIYFYAVRYTDVGAVVLIPHELWKQLDCGLKIAYAYNAVLSQMENIVSRS